MRRLSLIVVFISLMGVIRSQDVIYLNDGASIKAKIVELTTETIKYKKSDQLEGPLRNISLSEVFMIIYENGTREVFKAEKANDHSGTDQTSQTYPLASNSKIKGNITFLVQDKRQQQLIVGKAPSKAARAVGLIVQPLTKIKDEGKIIYTYAEKTLSQILLANGFRNDNAGDYHLEVYINDLYSKSEVGLYGRR